MSYSLSPQTRMTHNLYKYYFQSVQTPISCQLSRRLQLQGHSLKASPYLILRDANERNGRNI